MTPNSSTYRPDIDGLRAAAVLAVIAYHYGVPGLPGGFTGVDVFFVISGFLITSIVRQELMAGAFSFAGFYTRRIRRIVPALLVVIVATLLAGYFILWPEDYMWLGWSGIFAAIGASNFFFARNINYFSQAAEFMPLLHTWSLGVEEQFYLVWPLFLVMAAKWLRRLLVPALAFVVVASFVGAFDVSHVRPADAFYMLPFRAWELGLGGLVAFLPAWRGGSGLVLRLVGFALVGYSFLIVRSDQPFPSPFALPACLGTALLVWQLDRDNRMDSITGWLAPLGRLSYSLYLWHWPVISLYRSYKNALPVTPVELVVLFAATILLSALSYHLIEKPFRWSGRRPPMVFLFGGAGVAAVVLIGVATGLTGGWNMRLSEKDRPLQNIQAMWDWPCPQWLPLGTRDDGYCRFGATWQNAKGKAIVWGDSHAQHLAPLLDSVARNSATSFILAGECAAAIGSTVQIAEGEGYRANCRNTRSEVLSLLAADPSIDLLILSSAWSVVVPKLVDPEERVGDGQPELLYDGLRELIEQVRRPGLRIVIIADNPNLPDGVGPVCAIDQYFLIRQPNACRSPQVGETRAQHQAVAGEIDALFRRIAAENPDVGVEFIADRMCATGACLIEIDGEFLYRDAGHFRRNLPDDVNRQLAVVLGLDRLVRQ